MLPLISFLSFFSSFVILNGQTQRASHWLHETIEKYEENPFKAVNNVSVFSLRSFFSLFVYHRAVYLHRRSQRLLQAVFRLSSIAVISNSQPTRCGHTLRGVHCRGLAGDVVPSTPAEAERQKP